MWQRIQTLYLGIATGLVAAMFFCNFADIIGPEGEVLSIRYYEKTPYLILMIMILAAQICSVFSFKAWFLQARVSMISALLLVGFQIWLGIDFLSMHNEMIFNISGVFPIAATILDVLAARAAMIDELTMAAVKTTRKARKKSRNNQ